MWGDFTHIRTNTGWKKTHTCRQTVSKKKWVHTSQRRRHVCHSWILRSVAWRQSSVITEVPQAGERRWHKAKWYVIFDFYFHPCSNPLSLGIFVVPYFHSHLQAVGAVCVRVCVFDCVCVCVMENSKKPGLSASLPGAPGREPCQREPSKQLYGVVVACLSLRWIFSKVEAHHVVTV